MFRFLCLALYSWETSEIKGTVTYVDMTGYLEFAERPACTFVRLFAFGDATHARAPRDSAHETQCNSRARREKCYARGSPFVEGYAPNLFSSLRTESLFFAFDERRRSEDKTKI